MSCLKEEPMKTSSRFLALLAAFALALFAFGAQAQTSANEPTIDQIYSAAKAGQMDRADAMIATVLKNHPNSAKAHYVKAELAAREGKQDVAKQELATAEKIAPGLPFAKAESVQALRNQLSNTPSPAPARRMGDTAGNLAPVQAPVPSQRSFPWGTLALIALVFVVGIAFLRRRTITQPAADGYGGAYGNSPAAPYGQTGYGPVYPPGAPQQPSMGSTLGRGLATGLAVGAGVVAAEEIGHRMFGQHEANAAPLQHDNGNAPSLDQIDDGMRRNLNTDMGGNDFGMNDAGSWDDGGGDVGGGGWDS
jgi:hypothetical protein